MTDDRWIKCISQRGNIRGVAVQATGLARRMAALHGIKGDVAQALGEATIGALLIGSFSKPGDRTNLNIRGSAFIQQALVDAYPDGKVRGFVVERTFKPGQFDATQNFGPWGDGVLSVLRTKTGEREKPYIGTVPLLTGFLAKDLTFYWLQSEQIPSAVGIAVNLKGDQITAAGGFLVQALPGATDAEVKMIETHIHEIQSFAQRLDADSNPMSLLSQIFQDTAFLLLEEKQLRFECECSWERVERALSLVGVAELQDMLVRDEGASVRCDFCTKEYKVDADRLKYLIEQSQGPK
jgi:molecular chaperone Hsp33